MHVIFFAEWFEVFPSPFLTGIRQYFASARLSVTYGCRRADSEGESKMLKIWPNEATS